MEDAEPVRITLARGSAEAVNRRFIGGFFVFAILFAGAAFYRPAIQAFAVGFPIYLVLWKLRLRAAVRPGRTLVVSKERMGIEGTTGISRNEVYRLRLESFSSRNGPGLQYKASNSEGEIVYRIVIDDDEEQGRITEVFGALGWPLESAVDF